VSQTTAKTVSKTVILHRLQGVPN